MAILAPIAARLLYLACSRKREYLADASAGWFTRYPNGLAGALEKLSSQATPMKKKSRAVAPLFIVNPLQGRKASNLFSTHPPSEERIRILRSMGGGAGYLDYEKAYQKVHGKSDPCIGKNALESAEAATARAPSSKTKIKMGPIFAGRETMDFLDGLMELLIITCPCGMRIKLPQNFKKKKIRCPRCKRSHHPESRHSVPLLRSLRYFRF